MVAAQLLLSPQRLLRVVGCCKPKASRVYSTMSKSLALVMLGDIMLGRIVDESLDLPGAEQAVWGDFLPLLQGGVRQEGEEGEEWLVAGNLECAVTQETKKVEKAFNFALHPRHAGALRSACLSFVSLANNHSLDFTETGLRETMAVLDQEGIAFAGTGTAEQAARPAFVHRGGLSLAFFSFSDHPDDWAASLQRPRLGINYIDPGDFDRERLQAQFGAAREQGADLVVVFVHWGPNWQWLPSKPIQSLGHAFIDCGADIVFGHSAHHIQGIEVYQGKPIVYGAGGWIDDYRLHGDYRNDLSFLYCCHIRGGVPQRLELLPSKISHAWREGGGQPPYVSTVSRAVGGDKKWLERTLKRLCSNFRTNVETSERGFVIKLAEAPS